MADAYVFLCGGYIAETYLTLASVERYSLGTDSWSPMPDMNVRRQNASACTLGLKIYVFCGYDPVEDFMNTVEVLSAD